MYVAAVEVIHSEENDTYLLYVKKATSWISIGARSYEIDVKFLFDATLEECQRRPFAEEWGSKKQRNYAAVLGLRADVSCIMHI